LKHKAGKAALATTRAFDWRMKSKGNDIFVVKGRNR
jgi:hypothetical protein